MTLTFLPILPLWAVALAGVVLFALLAHGTVLLRRKRVPGRWIAILGALRIVAVALFLLMLLRPVVRRMRTVTDRPNLMVMLDASRSMGENDAGDADPRLHDALRAMQNAGLRARLEKSFDLSWFAFDRDARPVADKHVDDLAARGQYADLARSIKTASLYQHMRASDNGRASGGPVLLISDGNDQGGGNPVEAARRLGLTVYALAPRDVPKPAVKPHVVVASFRGPTSILLGSEARFDARLQIDGPVKPGPVQLTLQCDGRTVATRKVILDGKHTRRQVTIAHRPLHAGRREYRLQVHPVNNGPAFESGPPPRLSVQVRARRLQVLVLENRWRWTFHFLRRVLENDPHFAYTAFLSRRSGTYMQFAEPDAEPRLSGFPRSREQLEAFDIIVLGDVDPALWPPDLAPAIHDLVIERGKSLIVIAGPGLERLARTPALRGLLPVIPKTEAGYVAGPVHLVPAPGADASPLFYTPQGADFFKVFDDLPPMDQVYAPIRKKPGAGVLLQARKRANAAGNLIVAARQTVGRGHVLYLATDTLWKWQTLASRDAQGRTPYEIFWHQALRALAPRPTDQGAAGLVLQTGRSQYKVAQTAHFRMSMAGAAHDRLDVRFELRVKSPDGRTMPLAVQPSAQQAGVFTARYTPTASGTYTITAQAKADDETLAQTATSIFVAPRTIGPPKRSNNMALLQRLAGATGGKVVALDDPNTWPHVTPGNEHVVQKAQIFDLWQNAVLLLVIVGVLGCDWLIRLLRGFV